jgi:hypothetical protein
MRTPEQKKQTEEFYRKLGDVCHWLINDFRRDYFYIGAVDSEFLRWEMHPRLADEIRYTYDHDIPSAFMYTPDFLYRDPRKPLDKEARYGSLMGIKIITNLSMGDKQLRLILFKEGTVDLLVTYNDR